jgi:hypothetical protein
VFVVGQVVYGPDDAVRAGQAHMQAERAVAPAA